MILYAIFTDFVVNIFECFHRSLLAVGSHVSLPDFKGKAKRRSLSALDHKRVFIYNERDCDSKELNCSFTRTCKAPPVKRSLISVDLAGAILNL